MSKYTDRTDVSVVISLHEYGCIRDPKTDRTIIMQPVRVGEWVKLKARTTFISEDDVIDALEEVNDVDKGFFDFIGMSFDEVAEEGLNNDHLSYYITSLNDYNGWFMPYAV